MAVNIHNLDGYVRQAIESTGSTAAKHELGFTVRDRSTGKQYMYILFNNGGGNVTATIGAPVGIYQPDNGTTVATTVTNDQSDANVEHPIGVMRSILGDGKYGWIEIIQKHLVTTVKVVSTGADDWEAAWLVWSADSVLTSTLLTTAAIDGMTVVGRALDSNGDANAWVYVQWL